MTKKRTRRKFDSVESLAYHEAAHWVVATAFGVHVYEVSIQPDNLSGGRNLIAKMLDGVDPADGSESTRLLVEKFITIHLAGFLAQQIHFPSHRFSAEELPLTDLQKLFRTADQHYQDRTAQRASMRSMVRLTRRFLRANWSSVELMAKALLKSRTLSFPLK